MTCRYESNPVTAKTDDALFFCRHVIIVTALSVSQELCALFPLGHREKNTGNSSKTVPIEE
jgi:hypothetical protein